MNDPTTPNTDNQNTPTPSNNWAVGLLSTLGRVTFLVGINLITIYFLFHLTAKRFIAEGLKQAIELSSDNLYRLEYEEIKFDFFNQKILLQEVYLLSNNKKYHELEVMDLAPTKLYNVHIPKGYIQGMSFLDILTKKEISIDHLLIQKPQLRIVHTGSKIIRTSVASDPVKFDPKDLKKILSNQLKRIHVQELFVEDGRLIVDRWNDKSDYAEAIEDFSIFVAGFDLNEHSDPQQSGKIFYADGFNIKMLDQSLELKHNNHILNVEELELSTFDNRIFLGGVSLIPEDTRKTQMQIELNVQDIIFDEIDFEKIYHDKKINISEIKIDHPTLKVKSKLSSGQIKNRQESGKGLNIYPAIEAFINEIQIDKISLVNANASFAYLKNQLDRKKPIDLPVITINLYNFLVDSATHEYRKKSFYIDDFDITVLDPEIRKFNKHHTFTVDNLFFSSKHHQLLINNAHFSPDYSTEYLPELWKKDIAQLWDVKVPKIKLDGVDIWQLVIDNELYYKNLTVISPTVINYRYPAFKPKQPKKVNIDSLYNKFERKVHSWSFHKFKLQNASYQQIYRDSISTIKPVVIEDLTLQADGFLFDKNTLNDQSRLLFSKNLSIEGKKASFLLKDSLYLLEVGSLDITMNDSVIGLHSGKLIPLKSISDTTHSKAWEIGFDDLNLNGVDFLKFYHHDSLNIEEVSLNYPRISLLQRNPIDGSTMSDSSVLTLDSLSIEEGRFHATMTRHKNNNGDTVNISVAALDTTQHNPKVGLLALDWVGVKDLSINHGFFQNLKMNPDGQFYEKVKELNSFSLNLHEFSMGGILEVDSLNNVQDSIAVKFSPASNLSLEFSEMNINAEGFMNRLAKAQHVLTIDNIDLSTSKQGLVIQNIVLSPLDEIEPHKPLLNIEIPEASFKGIDLKNLFANQKLLIDTILIDQPKSNLVLKHPDPNKPKPKKKIHLEDLPDLFGLHENLLTEAKLNHFVLEDGSLDMILNADSLPQKLNISNYSIHFFGTQMDSSTSMGPDNFLYTEDIVFHANDFKFPLKDSVHILAANEIHFSTKDRGLTVTDISLKVDERVNHKLLPVIMDVEVPSVALTGIDLFRFYKTKALGIEEFIITEPNAQILANKRVKHKKDKSIARKKAFPTDSLYQLISKPLKGFYLDTFLVEHGSLNYTALEGERTKNTFLEDFSVGVHQIALDSSTNRTTTPLYSHDISFSLRNYQQILDSGRYELAVDNIGFSTGDQRFFANDVSFSALDSKKDFMAKMSYENDWMNINIPKVSLESFDFPHLVYNQGINAQVLDIDQMKAFLYRDKSLPDADWKRPPSFPEMIKKIPIDLNIDSLKLRKAYIEYQELAENGRKPGKVFLNNTNVLVRNISNDSVKIANNSRIEMQMKGFLMGSGSITTNFSIPMNDEKGYHMFYGKMGRMDMRDLNPILKPVAFININTGQAQKMEFSVLASERYANGFMKFHYKDLNVTILNADKFKRKTEQEKKRRFISLMANAFVVNSKNPKTFFSKKKGNIFFERDEEKSYINYWIKSILSGIKTSVGININSKPPKAIRKEVRKAQKQFRKRSKNTKNIGEWINDKIQLPNKDNKKAEKTEEPLVLLEDHQEEINTDE